VSARSGVSESSTYQLRGNYSKGELLVGQQQGLPTIGAFHNILYCHCWKSETGPLGDATGARRLSRPLMKVDRSCVPRKEAPSYSRCIFRKLKCGNLPRRRYRLIIDLGNLCAFFRSRPTARCSILAVNKHKYFLFEANQVCLAHGSSCGKQS
jgi:hypothetical protein